LPTRLGGPIFDAVRYAPEVYRRVANNAHRDCRQCLAKMPHNPASRSTYEDLHDRSLARGYFNDACAREWAEDKAVMIQRLRAAGQLLSIDRSAAFDEDRFRNHFHALVERFAANEPGL
jgi:hypothetical protein